MKSILGAALTVHRYWYILYKMIAPPPGARTDSEFDCREVTRDDLPLLDTFRPHRSRDEIAAWVEDPETLLFVAFHGDRAVAYDCISLEVPARAPFSRLKLASDEVWVRDVYTVPEYRSRRIIRTLRVCRNAVLGDLLGFRGTVSAVAEDNGASLAASYDSLTWKVEGFDYRRVLTSRHVRVDRDARERLEHALGLSRSRIVPQPVVQRLFAVS